MTTSYSVGDPVRISDAEGEAWGVVVGNVDASTIEVQLLKQGSDHVYRIEADCYHVPHEAVVEHEALHGDDGLAPRAFHDFGFRMLDGSSFVRHEDEDAGYMLPVGDAAFEVASEDDDDDDDMRDFIVDDAECEPFHPALEDNDFVRETHQAVRAFNDWVPADDQQAAARSFLLRQEERAARIDDEARFAQNLPAISYHRPGTHAK